MSRFPPSPSGVALYARDFDAALERVWRVERLEMPQDPAASQRVVNVIWLVAKLMRLRHRHGASTICWIQLAGRGIAEWVGVVVAARIFAGSFVTIHDAPAVTGGLGFLKLLDRRGLRRVAALISRALSRVELRALQQASLVTVLSQHAAETFAPLGLNTVALAHVVRQDVRASREPGLVFMPGYVSGLSQPFVTALAAMVEELDAKLLVGPCDRASQQALMATGSSRISFTGLSSEESMELAFARAEIVLRWVPDGGLSAANSAATGGPVLRGIGFGCAVVTNDSRGSAEYVKAAGGFLVTKTPSALEALAALLTDSTLLLATQARARLYASLYLSPESVANSVADLTCNTT